MGQWRFPSNGGGVAEGFNASSIDLFHGNIVESLVRESIQNSLDASAHPDSAVHVALTLDQLAVEDHDELCGLRSPIAAGKELVAHDSHATAKEKVFYERAEKLLNPSSARVNVLGIHDYYTTGLTGSFRAGQRTPWLALVHTTGLTVKSSNTAGGSYGHGSAAPFALSDLRTLFYYTQIAVDDSPQRRFQGKCVLQSLPLESLGIDEEGLSQATGFFSTNDQNHPLTNEQVPAWAANYREAVAPEGQDGRGTSVYVLEPRIGNDSDEFWARVAVGVIANFYYAIATGRLLVQAGDVILDSHSIQSELIRLCAPEIMDALDLADSTTQAVQSARTIAFATHQGDFDRQGFGQVKWFMRIGEDITWRTVGLARSAGMLVTRTPPNLERFRGLRYFDMFVCVEGGQGSAVLRDLENPAHDRFEFDRIEEPDRQQQVKKAYQGFATQIRNIITENAQHEVVDELWSSQLDHFFSGHWGASSEGYGEPNSIELRVSPPRKARPKEGVPTEVLDESESYATGRIGKDQRGGSKKTSEKNFDDPFGEAPKRGRKLSGRQVKDLRISKVVGEENVADVYFTPVDKDRKNLVLLLSGERERQVIEVRPLSGGEWRSRHHVGALQATARKHLRLEFPAGILGRPIEGRLEP